MDKNDLQRILDRLLDELRSGDEERVLPAMRELATLRFSSAAIVRELEGIALAREGDIRSAALEALALPASLNVAAEHNAVPLAHRRLILREIGNWQNDGLIEGPQAEILKRRYDFDLREPTPVAPAPPPVQPAPAREQAVVPAEPHPPIHTAPSERPESPAGPRPTLLQTLLSESSIKVYLYLGAFFVIAAAIILAALVEAARIPILAAATVAFGTGALILRARLPQPSFALFIVFSFLLPISANVVEQVAGLTEPGLSVYWTLVLLGMAAIWSLSTWMYGSRFFTIVAFISVSLAANRLAGLIGAAPEIHLFLIMLAGLAGLGSVHLLRIWKDEKFSAPLFWVIQVQTAVLLLASILAAAIHVFEPTSGGGAWLLGGLTWIAAVVFYIASERMHPSLPFVYPAVGTLLPLPWFFLNAVDASTAFFAFGFWGWGTLLAFASEAAVRVGNDRLSRAYWPLLAGSGPLFLAAIATALLSNQPYIMVGILALTAFTCGALHALRPRWFVWSAALLSGVAAYFFMFLLPPLAAIEIPLVHQVVVASILLVSPELFARTALTYSSQSRWPALLLGILVSLSGMFLALIETEQPDRSTLVWAAYTILLALHAVHSRQIWLVYVAAGAGTLSILAGLSYLNLDLQLPVLTGYSILLYLAGFALRLPWNRGLWGTAVINSGLTLGIIVALVSLTVTEVSGGWHILLIAAMFTLELFARPLAWLELVVEALLSIFLYQILIEFRVDRPSQILFGLSVIWLTADLAFGRLIKTARGHGLITTGVGSTLALIGGLFLLMDTTRLMVTAPYWAVYAVLSLLHATYRKQPQLAYLTTTAVGLVILNLVQHLSPQSWLTVFTAFSAILYLAGLSLRRSRVLVDWGNVVINSGLGLGIVLSLAALISTQQAAGWHVIGIAGLFAVEAIARPLDRLELAVEALLSISLYQFLRDFGVQGISHLLWGLSLIWLGGDLVFSRLLKADRAHRPITLTTAFILVFLSTSSLLEASSLAILSTSVLDHSVPAGYFVIYSALFLLYALVERNPAIGYFATAFLTLGVFKTFAGMDSEKWLFPLIALAVIYYLAGYILRRISPASGWEQVLRYSGLGLGLFTSLGAPLQGGLDSSIPVAIAATLFAVEAVTLRSVWRALPANMLYLMSYLIILIELRVDQPQYYSIGTALIGMLMHYLLTRAGSRSGAFLAGLLSQFVLLGTTYYQMVSTSDLSYFFVLFIQSMVILAYGIVMRSRSLVLASTGFAILGVVTVLYSALRGLSLVILIGVTGITLLVLGILAVIMRERITTLAERFGDWNA